MATETIENVGIADTPNREIHEQLGRKYEAGFVTDIESDSFAPGLDEDVIRDMMKAETWISAEEAVNMGIATEKRDGSGAKQSMEARTLYNTIMKLKSVEDELFQVKEKEAGPVNSWDKFFRG